jgi:hypothetical protein
MPALTVRVRIAIQLIAAVGALALSVCASALTIASTSPLPSATLSTPYSQTLTATGAFGGVAWSVTAGGLPPGLSLSTGGVISGTPTARGTASFTVKAQDNSTSVTKAFTLTVDDDDDGFIPLIASLGPKCTLAASPASPVVASAFSLTATCTDAPTQYVWNGPGIAINTTTTGNTLAGVVAPNGVTSGNYTVVAKKGNLSGALANLLISFGPGQPPTVTWSVVPAGISYTSQAVTFQATATDPDANQSIGVQFYIGNQAIGSTQSGNRWTLNWTPSNEGIYLVRAVATDAAGQTAEITHLQAVTVAPAAGGLAIPATASVGTIPGTLAIGDSGAATYSIPIQVPPGTAGLQPALSLVYSSQAGESLAGLGWSLGGLSAVYRCPKTYATDTVKTSIQYDNSGGTYCLDGERLVEVSATNIGTNPSDPVCGAFPRTQREYRTERDTYARVRSVEDNCRVIGPSNFEVITKSAQILDFGTRWWVLNNGGVSGRSNASKVWPLDKVYDRAGNYLTIDYGGTNVIRSCFVPGAQANGPLAAPMGPYPATEFFPTRILYTRNDSQSNTTAQQVLLNYAARPVDDQLVLYDMGRGQSQLTQRLTSIQTFQGGTISGTFTCEPNPGTSESYSGALVSTYTLDYGATPSAATKRSTLQAVTLKGADGVSLPPTVFTYEAVQARTL